MKRRSCPRRTTSSSRSTRRTARSSSSTRALATAAEADAAIRFVKESGCTNIKFVCIFASEVGVRLLYENHPDVEVYAANYAPGPLNEQGYIYTAAGDAGDRLCGTVSYKPQKTAECARRPARPNPPTYCRLPSAWTARAEGLPFCGRRIVRFCGASCIDLQFVHGLDTIR